MASDLKISIVTIVRNNPLGIESAMDSFQEQDYQNKEHILVDGASTDNTVEVIRSKGSGKDILLTEPDKGIYNALNKGIQLASGDIIGILHSDDLFAHPQVLSKVADALSSPLVDGVYADLQYITNSVPHKVVRNWISGNYNANSFGRGWMPPHPTLFLRKEVFEKYGLYRENMKIAADYEFILRVLHKNNVRLAYIPEVISLMRVGGASNKSLKNILHKTKEDLSAWKSNIMPKGRRRAILMKNLRKIPQFFKK